MDNCVCHCNNGTASVDKQCENHWYPICEHCRARKDID